MGNNLINPKNLTRLHSIFAQKGWPIDSNLDCCDDPDGYVFENFCKMLSSLNDSQQELVLDLTEDFLWINEKDYRRLFYFAFDKLVENYTGKECSKIVITPMTASDNYNQHKSSHLLYYLICYNFAREKYQTLDVHFVDNYRVLFTDADKSAKICLIDDFIGAGTQALKAVSFLESKGIDRNRITILTLVIQNIGLDKCRAGNIEVFYAHLRQRGISDCLVNRVEKTVLMEEVEKIVNPPPNYCFGRDRTEALVKMIHIPNNTFPVFWYTNDKKFPVAPFKRIKL